MKKRLYKKLVKQQIMQLKTENEMLRQENADLKSKLETKRKPRAKKVEEPKAVEE